MSFDTKLVIQTIHKYCGSSPLWIAYSGGMDSHVLLQLLAEHRQYFSQSIQVVHVDHQLQSQSTDWAEHCRSVTEALYLPFHLLQVNVTDIGQSGLESAARTARYQAINQLIGDDDGTLLTGQHLQDQAETLVLQLLRGAGTRGLAAMKVLSQWQKMHIIRPFLAISHDALLAYATAHQLEWIDDPSNHNTEINRNFLRHRVWPLLQHRWPTMNQSLARSAQNLQESQILLDELAQGDLLTLQADQNEGSLDIYQLRLLSETRQRNVLRFFIKKLNMVLPSRKSLQRILDEVCLATLDAQPHVRWHQYSARRYQNKLYLSTAASPIVTTSLSLIHDQQPQLLDNKRQLIWQEHKGQGIRAELFTMGLKLQFRQGGEKIQLSGKSHHQLLKKLFQEWQIPVWERETIPLLFSEQRLVAVVGYACAEVAKPQPNQIGWLPTIEQR